MSGDACPVLLADGVPCGRVVWRERCLLHAKDGTKPTEEFIAQVQRTVEGVDVGQRQPGDLTEVQWYGVPLNRVLWSQPVTLHRAHFYGASPFEDSIFHGRADFTEAHFDVGGMVGSPQFLSDASFRGAQFEQVRLTKARFAGAANFSGVRIWSDSWILEGTFVQLADFSGSQYGELHFHGCRFESGITLANSSLRPGFVDTRSLSLLLDLTGVKAYFELPTFDGFRGAFFAAGARFEQNVNLSGGEFTEGDFSGATFMRGVTLSGALFDESVSFRGAVIEGAADLIDLDVRGEGVLDLSRLSLGAPHLLRLLRVNQRAPSPSLRLRIASTNIEGARIENINWHRDHRHRVKLEDEAAVERGEEDPRHVSAAYRRLRTIFEATHLYEEAEDCVWGSMEMRRQDKNNPLVTRGTLKLYQLASYYGSSYERAVRVLLLLVFVLLPVSLGAFGLKPRGEKDPVEHQIRTWQLPHGHSAFEGRWDHAKELAISGVLDRLRQYTRGLLHTLQVITFQDETIYQPSSVGGQIAESVGRAVVPGQLALFLLALRRRFTR